VKSFSAKIPKLGINPYVAIPEKILHDLFGQAGKTKGPLPVGGKLNGNKFKQTIVKYQGAWRLYLNTPMRRGAGIDVGNLARVKIEFDPEPRIVPMHPMLSRALADNREAKTAFKKLPPFRQKEILRYLGFLKTEESAKRIVEKVMQQRIGRKTKGLNFSSSFR
jgi:hypothetical protein